METISSDDDFSSSGDDLFFDATPGVKRSSSHDGTDYTNTTSTTTTNLTTASNNDTNDTPVASTSKVPYSPHKRVRTVPPAPPKGVKRANANRRLSDQQQHFLGADGHDNNTQQNIPSDSDASFQRHNSRPNKRLKSTSVSLAREVLSDTARSSARQKQVPPPQRDKKRLKRQQAKSRLSSSFNFVPATQQLDDDLTSGTQQSSVHPALVEIENLRQAGNAHYRLNEYESALIHYTKALEQYPKTITVSPPLSLLTNRAAAYISLGQWEEALQDMLQALSYPCSDIEGNVKRLARYLRCLLALGKLEGTEVTEGLKHAQNQLLLLRSNNNSPAKLIAEGQKAVDDLMTVKRVYDAVSEAREKADWPEVVKLMEDLLQAHKASKRKAPVEWKMMHAEALGWLGRGTEAKEMIQDEIKNFPDDDPRKLWFSGLFAYADANIKDAVAALDALRLATILPTQASRLLHRAYSINTMLTAAEKMLFEERPLKAISSYNEILRIASSEQPINDQIRLAAMFKRAQAYFQARNTASAHEDLGTYLAFDSLTEKQRFDALAFRGNIFMTSGQLDAALKDLQAARALSSGSQATMRDIDAQIKKIKQPKVDKRRYRPNASPYEILGLATSATSAEIRKAYKTESLKHHPDKGGDADVFKRISDAYTLLSNAAPMDSSRLRSRGRYR